MSMTKCQLSIFTLNLSLVQIKNNASIDRLSLHMSTQCMYNTIYRRVDRVTVSLGHTEREGVNHRGKPPPYNPPSVNSIMTRLIVEINAYDHAYVILRARVRTNRSDARMCKCRSNNLAVHYAG